MFWNFLHLFLRRRHDAPVVYLSEDEVSPQRVAALVLNMLREGHTVIQILCQMPLDPPLFYDAITNLLRVTRIKNEHPILFQAGPDSSHSPACVMSFQYDERGYGY